MANMENLNPEIARIIAAKAARRAKLAALPFPEKVGIVIRLQRMAAPIRRARGLPAKVWAIPR